ncbi:hypothetical protein [Absidia glauca]|uniref:Uncharacterized protein n=1 Tax=Absidia glauca TaxID=4829 RepID=A0A168TDJ1_ABSGL|nr:hypothetical protein [Absidia glauca]
MERVEMWYDMIEVKPHHLPFIIPTHPIQNKNHPTVSSYFYTRLLLFSPFYHHYNNHPSPVAQTNPNHPPSTTQSPSSLNNISPTLSDYLQSPTPNLTPLLFPDINNAPTPPTYQPPYGSVDERIAGEMEQNMIQSRRNQSTLNQEEELQQQIDLLMRRRRKTRREVCKHLHTAHSSSTSASVPSSRSRRIPSGSSTKSKKKHQSQNKD